MVFVACRLIRNQEFVRLMLVMYLGGLLLRLFSMLFPAGSRGFADICRSRCWFGNCYSCYVLMMKTLMLPSLLMPLMPLISLTARLLCITSQYCVHHFLLLSGFSLLVRTNCLLLRVQHRETPRYGNVCHCHYSID